MAKCTYESKLVQCPFYLCEIGYLLKCEGVEVGTNIHLAFDTKTHKVKYKGKYCQELYKDCILYKMLEGKYDD